MTTRLRLGLAALTLALIASVPAAAQYGPGAGGKAPYSVQPPGRNEAGRFDYYSMVMSWSPSYCATAQRADPQCTGRGGRAYSFVLHGLWPQHDRGWPESCPTRERPFVPQPIINRMLDIMPSPQLVIHEYRKHGTCSGLSPEAYFEMARKLYAGIKVPHRFDRPNQALTLSPQEVVHEFVTANPGLKPENLAVVCTGPGNRLREVRVCYSKDGHLKSCGRNEDARRLCPSQRVYLPPVRGATFQGAPGRPGNPLPGPREEGPSNIRGERRI